MEERLIQSSSFSIRSPNSISELDDFGQLTFSELQILHQRGGGHFLGPACFLHWVRINIGTSHKRVLSTLNVHE